MNEEKNERKNESKRKEEIKWKVEGRIEEGKEEDFQTLNLDNHPEDEHENAVLFQQMQRDAFSHETPAPLIEIFSSEAYSNTPKGRDRDNYGFNVMDELHDDEEEECQKGHVWSAEKEKCEGKELGFEKKFGQCAEITWCK